MAIGGQFLPHRPVGFRWILRGAVDEMQQNAAALHMAKETGAEAGALGSPFNKARNVGKHKFPILRPHHSQVRVQGGEGIIGNLRSSSGDAGQESRLAGVRQANKTCIGDQLEAEPDPTLFPRPAGICAPGGAVRRGLVMRIAEAAVTAFC